MTDKPLTINEIAERLKLIIDELQKLIDTPKEETK
jgi:hypothetical protein